MKPDRPDPKTPPPFPVRRFNIALIILALAWPALLAWLLSK